MFHISPFKIPLGFFSTIPLNYLNKHLESRGPPVIAKASEQLKPALAAMDAMREPEKPAQAPEETAPAPGAYAQGHGQEIDRRQDGAGGPNLPGPDIHSLP